MTTFSEYLAEGARLLTDVRFGFAVRRGLWDSNYWEETGQKQKGARVLRLKAGKSATQAVQAIFDNPRMWSFDCSQFCQVVNFYAQMKTMNDAVPGSFDKQIADHGGILEIKPFQGAYFTSSEHYYRREKQTDWMKYRASPNMPYEETRITAWDLVKAAPVGSRVNFSVGGGGDWNFENTVKVKAQPLEFAALGLGQTIWTAKDLMIKLAEKRDLNVKTFADASKYIWIKEVSIFQILQYPPHRSARP